MGHVGERIAAVASALGIEPDRLHGTPFIDTLAEDGPLEGLAALRTLLSEGVYVQAIEPRTNRQLRLAVREVEGALRNDRTRRALAQLADLIRELHGALHAANSDAERARAYEMLCATYIVAEGATCRLGYSSLNALVLDRLDWAASHADDSGYAVRSLMKRSRLLMANNATDIAMSLVHRGLDMVPGDSEGERVLRGYGHLRGAMVAARGRRLDVARIHIHEARTIAAPMTTESDLYTTDFGPGNVEIHSCAVELEAGDPGKAARDGEVLQIPSGMSPPRAGHHWQDNARAWLMSGKPERALAALNKAKAAAPQQTRLHPAVRETLYGIAAAEKRRTDTLAGFASWLSTSL